MAAFTHLCASSKTPDGINGRDNGAMAFDAIAGHGMTRLRAWRGRVTKAAAGL